jgi:CRISPR system Cascade subunit CasE
MSMIASMLYLDRRAVVALRITDPYSLHRVVYSLYEEQHGARQGRGILFADQGGDFNERRILMLADRSPANRVDGQYGQVRSKTISDDFLNYTHYRFKIIVNPTRRNNASRKLVPIIGRVAISDWFAQRAPEGWGFSVSPEHLQVDNVAVLRFNDKHQRAVTICQAHVQGQLNVTDRTQFCNSFMHGIGRARAFGCGLLQIVPLIDKPFA